MTPVINMTPLINMSATALIYLQDNLSEVFNQTSADDTIKNRTILASGLMFSAGVAGNVLALALMATSPPEQKRTVFYKLMAGLAFTDLVGTCATSPVVITIYATGTKLESDMPLCHYFSFMLIFAGFATMFLVCAMAIERYICLCHPYAYHCKLPKSFAKYAILISWLVSILIAVLPLLGLGHNTVQFPKTWCFFNSTSREPKDMAFNFMYAIISLIAIIATFICNIAVIVTVMALKKRQNALSATHGIKRYRSLAQRFAELHMVIMLIGVTVVFTACFMPLMVFTIICQTDVIRYINVSSYYLLMTRLASFNPILDPWVYLLVRRELRWRVICIIRKLFGFRDHSVVASPAQPTLSPTEEMACWSFCVHCLCDPPVLRSSVYLPRMSTMWGDQGSRSPSMIHRIPSTESCISVEKNIICQPSPSEELLLRKFAHARYDRGSTDLTATLK
ncbi:prostaglandin E2 receptor EP4 subtype-like [Physella acuta]|uniref:prostaglandin E2 receptor EP4 subtype-like n=1 Tax=Physella acuta TaxID=109671 RepID=UPI0027DB4E0D|nr:prostaglandin E2 receptor EP4 subtype-like [Physella acuta]XP_059160704.1 prostaglandin E2 receptor EP4 subtype-like [Physella acuta]